MKRRTCIYRSIIRLSIVPFLLFLVVSLPITLASELSLIYDDNGNLITGDGKYREYNEFNQLIRVREGNNSNGSILEEYIYHPTEDRILIKKINNDEFNPFDEVTVYVNDNFVRDRTNVPENDIITNNYYAKDENGIVGETVFNATQNNETYTFAKRVYYHNDHLGSTNVLTNESGEIIEQTFYEPFGGIISGGNTSRFDYEGKEFDSLVGDYDFHFRKYNPELMIFTKPDSIISNIYDPQQLNLYAFERNNPYRYTDPKGHVIEWAAVIYWGIEFIAAVGLFVGSVSYSKQIREESNKPSEPIPTENAVHAAKPEKQPNVMREATDAEKEAMRKARGIDDEKENEYTLIIKKGKDETILIRQNNFAANNYISNSQSNAQQTSGGYSIGWSTITQYISYSGHISFRGSIGTSVTSYEGDYKITTTVTSKGYVTSKTKVSRKK